MGATLRGICSGLALALVAAIWLGSSPDARAVERAPVDPVAGAFDFQPSGEVRDRVIPGEPRRLQRMLARAGTYSDGDGHSVYVEVDPEYDAPLGREQEVATFLGGLLHSSEMNRVGVLLTDEEGLAEICGFAVAACYFLDFEAMVIGPPESATPELPWEFVVAHEYGHHVAMNRRNTPWSAVHWGTKRWATYHRVCEGVRAGILYPGNSGAHYWENPGEAFAEAFAKSHYPAQPWEWTPFLTPDQSSYEWIEADVERPWLRNRQFGYRGRFRRGGDRIATRRVNLPLDGKLGLSLRGARGTDFDLFLLSGNRRDVLARSTSRDSTERLGYVTCGRSAAIVAVRRHRGFGRFRLSLSRP